MPKQRNKKRQVGCSSNSPDGKSNGGFFSMQVNIVSENQGSHLQWKQVIIAGLVMLFSMGAVVIIHEPAKAMVVKLLLELG